MHSLEDHSPMCVRSLIHVHKHCQTCSIPPSCSVFSTKIGEAEKQGVNLMKSLLIHASIFPGTTNIRFMMKRGKELCGGRQGTSCRQDRTSPTTATPSRGSRTGNPPRYYLPKIAWHVAQARTRERSERGKWTLL